MTKLKSIDRITKSFQIDEKYLSIYRIVFCIYLLFIIGLPDVSSLYLNDSLLFNPPSLNFINFFTNDFPSQSLGLFLSIFLQLTFFAVLFGWKTKYSSLILSLTLLISNGFLFTFGKIDHNIVMVLIPFAMSHSGWGNCYSIDKKNNELIEGDNGFSVFLVTLILSLGMFSAGITKVATGWLNPNLNGAQKHIYNYLAFNENESFYFLYEIESRVFWKTLDYLTLFLETGFFFSMFNFKRIQFLSGLAVFFHFFIWLSMGIAFLPHFIVYFLFSDLKKLFKKCCISIDASSLFSNTVFLSTLAIILFLDIIMYTKLDKMMIPSIRLLIPNLGEVLVFVVAFGVIINTLRGSLSFFNKK